MSMERRILCVEDNVDSCELIVKLIEGSGKPYFVTGVHNTEEALELIAQKPFHLYILDIWVPEIGGLQLSKRIRETDPTTPIVFFSAVDSRPSRSRALATGANEFLAKPDDVYKLVATIERLLESSEASL
jgi:CheY-like chemotaxis protein